MKHLSALRLVLVVLLTWVGKAATVRAGYYDTLYNQPTATLMRTAEGLRGADNDTAIICYSIVSSRYRADLSREEKMAVADASMRLYYIRRHHFGDLARCLTLLKTVNKIYNEFGVNKAHVCLNLGAIYQILANSTQSDSYNEIALHIYKNGVAEALRLKGSAVGDTLMLCVLNMSQSMQRLDSIEPLFNAYQKAVSRQKETLLRRYNLSLHTIFKCQQGKQHDRALAECEYAIAQLSQKKAWRYVAYTLTHEGEILIQAGKPQQAVSKMMEAHALVTRHEIRDFKNTLSEKIIHIARLAGRDDLVSEFSLKLAELQDNDSRQQQLMSIIEMENTIRENHYNAQLTENRIRQSRLRIIIVSLVVVVALVVCFLIVVIRKNHRLSHAHRLLYEKMQQGLTAATTPPSTPQQSTAKPTDSAEPPVDAEEQQLIAKIEELMSHSSEIYRSDFGIEDLATMTGKRSRYLSGLINSGMGCNFSTLLGRKRIEEACRRMSDTDRYGQLTIEGIANGVGFQSRSHFTLLFKKYVGMLPSEYYQIAQEHRKND